MLSFLFYLSFITSRVPMCDLQMQLTISIEFIITISELTFLDRNKIVFFMKLT